MRTRSPKRELLAGGGYEKFEDSESGDKDVALTVTARISNGASRHAMPSIPDLVYAALLYKDDESPENPESKDFAQGTAVESGKLNFSFQKPEDTSGTFTLEIFAFVKTEGGETPQFSKETALLSGYKEGLAIVGDAIVVTDPIALSSDKQGTVNLKIKVPDGCTLEFKELKIDDTTESDPHFAVTGASPNFVLAQKDENGISAGAYQVQFIVKKGSEIIYIFSEYINVINGLCTDTWSGLAKDEAKEITQSMISSIVYVRGTGEGWYTSNAPSVEADNDNSGSFLAPFATIQKAVDTIIARNDGTSVYTIYVDGTFTATSSAALADFNALSQTQKLSVKIAGLDASQKAVLDGGGLASGIVVGIPAIYASAEQKNMNLTLENLVIQNAISTSVGYGGAIMLCCKADNSHTIKKCEIKKNRASFGSAIYNEYASLDLQECLISENTTTNNGTVFLSKGASLTISSDVRIENNTSRYYAGGVYVGKDSEFRMNGGAIIGNKATFSSECGGGVYVAEGGAFTMNGGTISGNTAKNGGGVCIGASSSGMGAFKMSGEASIPAGDDGKNDVYLGASGTNIATITVADDLTAATTPVATITLADSAYTAERQVLSAGGSISEITQDICDKFALTEEGWVIAPDGTGTNGILARPDTIYLDSSSGDDDTNSGLTANKAVKTLLKAIELYEAYDAEKIMVCAEYTLPSGESTLLGRGSDEKHLTLVRYDGSSDVSGSFTGHLLTISEGTVTISNVTLDGNKENVSATGSLLYISGSDTTVTLGGGAILRNNNYKNSDGGGGVYIANGTFEMTDGSTITGNKTDWSGGGVAVKSYYATFEMSGGEISDNHADYNGGGVWYRGTFNMSGGTIRNNTAKNGGGAFSNKADLKLFNMTGGKIINNSATNQGGGVYAYGKFTMEDGEITGNTAPYGAGVYVNGGTFTMTKGTISGNKAIEGDADDCGQGGGVYVNSAKFEIGDAAKIIGNNAASSGGGVYIYKDSAVATLIVNGGEINDNTAAGDGGGIYNQNGTFTMNAGTISGNTADYKGGGVYAGDSATVTLTNCAIESCKTTSTTSGNGGGGIYSLGTLIVTGGTISDCIAGRSGGGIYAYGGTVKCSDGVAFSNCEATGSGSVGSGGGICINSGVTVNVSDCTFVLCKAGASGGGIWNAGELIVSNTSFTTCSANNKGGGICNSDGTVDPINVTYSDCTASSDNDTSGF